MSRKTLYTLVLLTLTAALAVVGAGGASVLSASKSGGTLKLATQHDITSFDQFQVTDNESIRAISQITEGLFKTDAKGRLQPWLATRDTVSKNGLIHRLTLRSGVVFSNGKPFTSADVRFTLAQAQKSAAWNFLISDVKEVDAPNRQTVVLHLFKPSAALQADLALFAFGIVPSNFAGMTEADFGQHPIGTGAFTLSQWDRGTRVVLQRNPHYWQKGRPFLGRVELIGVPDDNNRITQVLAKQVDVAANPLWPELGRLESASGVHVGQYALARVDELRLNTQKAPFNDIRVREAVSLAIDRQALVKASLSGHGKPTSSFLAPSVPYYAVTPLLTGAQAIAKAKQLMQAAGNPSGSIDLVLASGDAVSNTLAQVIQANLAQIGIQVKLLPLDKSAASSAVHKGNYAANISYLTSDILDPDELASYYVATNGFSTFSNPSTLAQLAQQAAQEQNPASRKALYAAFQHAVTKDYGFIPLQVEPWVYGVSDRVQGFTVNGTGIWDLSAVSLTK